MSESSDPPLWAEPSRSRPRSHHRHSWQQRAGLSPSAPQQVAETSPPNPPKSRWGGGTCLPFASLCTEGHYQLISGAGDSGNTSHNGCRVRVSAWYVLMCRDVAGSSTRRSRAGPDQGRERRIRPACAHPPEVTTRPVVPSGTTTGDAWAGPSGPRMCCASKAVRSLAVPGLDPPAEPYALPGKSRL